MDSFFLIPLVPTDDDHAERVFLLPSDASFIFRLLILSPHLCSPYTGSCSPFQLNGFCVLFLRIPSCRICNVKSVYALHIRHLLFRQKQLALTVSPCLPFCFAALTRLHFNSGCLSFCFFALYISVCLFFIFIFIFFFFFLYAFSWVHGDMCVCICVAVHTTCFGKYKVLYILLSQLSRLFLIIHSFH